MQNIYALTYRFGFPYACSSLKGLYTYSPTCIDAYTYAWILKWSVLKNRDNKLIKISFAWIKTVKQRGKEHHCVGWLIQTSSITQMCDFKDFRKIFNISYTCSIWPVRTMEVTRVFRGQIPCHLQTIVDCTILLKQNFFCLKQGEQNVVQICVHHIS